VKSIDGAANVWLAFSIPAGANAKQRPVVVDADGAPPVSCLDLPAILRGLWVRQVVSKERVRQLLRFIETEQGMVIKNKDAIFD